MKFFNFAKSRVGRFVASGLGMFLFTVATNSTNRCFYGIIYDEKAPDVLNNNNICKFK